MRFWASWYQTTENEPPAVASWITGVTGEHDDTFIFCAVIDAPSEEAAKASIKEAGRWRFCEEQPADWMPPTDRFPL